MKSLNLAKLTIAPAILVAGLLSCAAHAKPIAAWKFNKAQSVGNTIKVTVGPDIPALNAQFITDNHGEALVIKQGLPIADPHTKVPEALPTQNFTVSTWVALDIAHDYGGILGALQDNGEFERGWTVGYNRSHKFTFGIKSTGNPRMTYLSSKTAYEPGRWYHVAGTYDGATMRLYVNGVLESQSADQNGPIDYPTAAPFILGAHKDDTANFPMTGRIREATIDDSVLSAEQIAAQFQPLSALAQLAPVLVTVSINVAPSNTPGMNANVAPSNKKVLIIGTDGTRPDKLEAANIPNIRALIATSAYSNTAQTRVPTVSGPSWSSMLTGVWSDKHGVKNNAFTGKNYAQYPDFLTRLEKLNPKFSTFAAADWEPILTGNSNGPLISDSVDGKIYFKGHTSENDQRIADAASHYLTHQNVDAAFVYVGDVDGVGHSVGPLHPQYTVAIETMDKQVGQIIAAVRSRPNYAHEDWLILISTDHGHVDKGGHGGPSKEETTIFFLAHGPSVDTKSLTAPVEVVDVAVTALAHLGVKIDPAWALDGKVQAQKMR